MASEAVTVEYIGYTFETMEVQVRVDTSQSLTSRMLLRSKLKGDISGSTVVISLLYRLVHIVMALMILAIVFLAWEVATFEHQTCVITGIQEYRFNNAELDFCRVEFSATVISNMSSFVSSSAPSQFVFSSGGSDMQLCNSTATKARVGDRVDCFFPLRTEMHREWMARRSLREYGYLQSHWSCLWDVFSGISSLCVPLVMVGFYVSYMMIARLILVTRVSRLAGEVQVEVHIHHDSVEDVKRRIETDFKFKMNMQRIVFLGRELHNYTKLRHAVGSMMSTENVRATLHLDHHEAVSALFRGYITLQLRVVTVASHRKTTTDTEALDSSQTHRNSMRHTQLSGNKFQDASVFFAIDRGPSGALPGAMGKARSNKIVHSLIIGKFLEEYFWQAARMALLLACCVWGMVCACAMPWVGAQWLVCAHLVYLPSQLSLVLLPFFLVFMIYDLNQIRSSLLDMLMVLVSAVLFFICAGMVRASTVPGDPMFIATVTFILGGCFVCFLITTLRMDRRAFAVVTGIAITLLLANFLVFITVIVPWFQKQTEPWVQIGIQLLVVVICQGINVIVSSLVEKYVNNESNLYILPVMAKMVMAIQIRFLQQNIPSLAHVFLTQLGIEFLNMIQFIVHSKWLQRSYPDTDGSTIIIIRERDVEHSGDGDSRTALSGLIGSVGVIRAQSQVSLSAATNPLSASPAGSNLLAIAKSDSVIQGLGARISSASPLMSLGGGARSSSLVGASGGATGNVEAIAAGLMSPRMGSSSPNRNADDFDSPRANAAGRKKSVTFQHSPLEPNGAATEQRKVPFAWAGETDDSAGKPGDLFPTANSGTSEDDNLNVSGGAGNMDLQTQMDIKRVLAMEERLPRMMAEAANNLLHPWEEAEIMWNKIRLAANMTDAMAALLSPMLLWGWHFSNSQSQIDTQNVALATVIVCSVQMLAHYTQMCVAIRIGRINTLYVWAVDVSSLPLLVTVMALIWMLPFVFLLYPGIQRALF